MGLLTFFKKPPAKSHSSFIIESKASKGNSETSNDYLNGAKTDYNADGETYYTTSDLVNSCVNYIAETGALTRLTVGLKDVDGKITPLKDKKINKLFNVAPNDFTTWSELLEQAIKSYLLTGNIFISFEKLKNYEMWLMPTADTKIVPDVNNFVAGYMYKDKITYNTDEMLQVRRGNIFNEHYGSSAILDVLSDYLTLEGNGIADLKSFYANGAVGTGVLETAFPLSKEQIQELREQFTQAYSNNNRHKTMVLPSDIKYKNVKLSPKDSMLLDSFNIAEKRVLRVFRLNSQVLGGSESFSNNISEVATMTFNTAILPIVVRIVAQLELFFRGITKKDNLVIIPSYSDIPYINKITESEAKSISQLTSSGILTINEARLSLGYTIKTGGAFDINFAPAYLLGGTPIALDTLDPKKFPTEISSGSSTGTPPNSVDPNGGSKK